MLTSQTSLQYTATKVDSFSLRFEYYSKSNSKSEGSKSCLPAILIDPEEELALIEHPPELVTLAAGALHADVVAPGQQLGVTHGPVMAMAGLRKNQWVLHAGHEVLVMVTELGLVPVSLAA